MNPFKYGSTVDGENFCRRPELARILRGYVESGQNVVVQGERRMGKTSLVLETIRGMKGVAVIHADLFCVRDTADLCRRLASALARFENTAGFLEKMVQSLARLRPTLSIDPNTGSPTVSVDAGAAADFTSLEAVLDAIIARTAKRKSCVILDEFQDVLDIEDGERIIAIMRGRIQLDSRTAYVFLGSVRNKMTDIFMHPNSPFYRGAAPLPVGEIDEKDFYEFLSSRFATGKRKLPRPVFDAIKTIARNTPGDMQELCDAIWDCTRHGQTISLEDVQRGLEVIFSRESDHYEIFMRRLTPLQMRVLAALAANGGREVFSVGFLSAANVLNAASAKRAIDRLVTDGLMFYNEEEYRFVNPFFKEWLRRNIRFSSHIG